MDAFFIAPMLLGVSLLALALGGLGGGGSDGEEPRTTENGTDDADSLTGTQNEDVFGLGGNDTIEGSGNSVIHGDLGDDTLVATGNADAFGGEGRDTLEGSGASVLLNGDAGDDNVTASEGATGRGGAGADRMLAETGSTVLGGGGNDLMFARGSDSTGQGGTGNDYLIVEGGSGAGEDGDDWLSVGVSGSGDASSATGGAGNDTFALHDGATVSGDIGADTFIGMVEEPLFSGTPDAEVVVSDYTPGVDRLLISVTAPIDAVTFLEIGGDTVVTVTTQATGGGDTPEGLVIRLEGVTGVSKDDFAFVTDLAENTVRGDEMGIRYGAELPLP